METIDEFTLAYVLERSASRFSRQRALGFVDEPALTFADLKDEVDRLSEFLRNQGITHGDRVALLGENGPQWGIAYFAVTTMGAVIVPILPDFHTSEIHHILRQSGAKSIFVSERFYHKVEELDFSTFHAVVLLDDFSIINPDTSKATLRQLMRDGSKELRKIRNIALRWAGRLKTEVKESDIASIIYTSGTSGHSKGVMLTHRNLVWNAEASARIPEINSEDRMMSVLPMAHVYECTLGLILPVLRGASVYYLRKPPTAAVLVPALASVKPTAILTVPLIIEKMYRARILPEIRKKKILRLLYKFPVIRRRINKLAGKKLMATFGGRVRFFGVGGAALSPEVEKFLREAEFPYAVGYGLTETSPLIAGSNAQTTRYRAIGPVLPEVEVKIDQPNPATGAGEIVVRGPGVMQGYYNDPERTGEVLSPDGWLRTGDLGSFDEDGYLYIRGRKKNMILGPSGENIYPEIIESVVNKSDYVIESIVLQDQGQLVARICLDYEKLDLEFAELGMTETQTKERIKQLLEEVRKQVNDQVSGFSRLARVIEQTEPFEKTATQKIKRYLYAEPGEHHAV